MQRNPIIEPYRSAISEMVEAAKRRTTLAPNRALADALELDRELERLAWGLPLTYSANGVASLESGHDLRLHGSATLNALAVAESCAIGGDYFAAIATAFQTVRGAEIAALNVLYANAALGVESLWLRFLNKYLAYFSLRGDSSSDITRYSVGLARGAGERFLRLQSAFRPDQFITEGPLISILMPVRDAALTLTKAAHSILGQTWKNLELILIDDCSSDQSVEVARSLKALDDRVRLVELNTPSGSYIAKNIGLQFSKGDFITVHDADDWAFPTRLADQIEPILQDDSGALSVTMGQSLRITLDGRLTRFQPAGWVTQDGVMRWCFPSPLFERGFFLNKLGAWDSVKIGADTEIVQRVRRFAPGALKVLDIPVMLQLDGEGSLTRHPDTYNDHRGESPAREHYRLAWGRWHASQLEMPRLEFPMLHRPFEVKPEIRGHTRTASELIHLAP